MKKYRKILFTILAIIILLSLAMKFHVVSEFVAGVFGTTPEVIQNGASMVFDVAVGIMLVSLGIAAATAIGVIAGGILVVVGLVFLGAALWKKFGKGSKQPNDL
jgi:hypothetical protein